MAENNSTPTEVHIYKPDQQGNTVVIEGEKHWNTNEDSNSSTITDSHYQKEQIIIENPNDPLSTITHRLEDIHVTVNHEEVKDKTNDVIDTAHDKVKEAVNVTTDLKHDAAAIGHVAEEKVVETAHNVQDKAAELKHDAAVVAHDTQEETKEVAHDVQDKAVELKHDTVAAAHVVEEKAKETAHNVQDKAGELKQDAVAVGHVVGDKAADAVHNVQDKAVELKHDAAAAAHVAGEKAKEVTHDVQDKAAELKHDASVATHTTQEKAKEVAHNVQEKASEIAVNTKDALIAGEKVVEEKLAAAKETVIEKSSGLVDSAKHTAHDASVKAQELEKAVEHKLEAAGKIGGQKIEETKQWLGEKGSEAKAKGAEILGATQQALATGAAVVTEKAKHGIELASGAASSVKAATGHLAADAQAKVVETAHNAQVKAGELLTSAETKAGAAAGVIATKSVEAKNTTVSAAQTATSTVQEKTTSLVDSTKHVLASTAAPTPSMPVVPGSTSHVSQEAYVTETARETVHGPEPVVTEHAASVTTKSTKGGPINAIRNFFGRIFNSASQRQEQRRKANTNTATNAPPQTTETTATSITTTTATVATSNPRVLS